MRTCNKKPRQILLNSITLNFIVAQYPFPKNLPDHCYTGWLVIHGRVVRYLVKHDFLQGQKNTTMFKWSLCTWTSGRRRGKGWVWIRRSPSRWPQPRSRGYSTSQLSIAEVIHSGEYISQMYDIYAPHTFSKMIFFPLGTVKNPLFSQLFPFRGGGGRIKNIYPCIQKTDWLLFWISDWLTN